MRARAVAASTVLLTVVSVLAAVELLGRQELVLQGRVEDPDVTGGALAVAWVLTGATLVWLRPRNVLGWLLLVVGGCQGLSQGLSAYGAYGMVVAEPEWPLVRWSAWSGSFLWLPGLLPLASLLPALYPDGRLPTRRWRWPVTAAVAGTVLLTVAAALDPGTYDDTAPGGAPLAAPQVAVVCLVVAAPLLIGSTLLIWVGSVVRLVRARAPERQQLAWLLSVVVVFVAIGLLGVPEVVFQVMGLLIPVAVGVGVLRYGLLGIEVLLRRGLVYAVLSTVVVLAYLAVTVLTGAQLDRGPLPGLVAAALAAVALAPLRERLQTAVDRVVYGDRRDPLRALARVGDTVAGPAQTQLLPSVLAAVADAVHAPAVAVLGPDGSLLAGCGPPAEGSRSDWVRFPLRVGGEEVGLLEVAPRRPSDVYTDGDRRLLGALAQQAAAVVRTLQLAEALERERDRVLTAVVAERDRLRRDLHDGLGPALAGIGLGLQAAQDERAAGNDAATEALLAMLVAEVRTSVAEVRRIVDDLRPAVLDREGLVGALRRHAATLQPVGTGRESLVVQVDADGLPALPPEVEVTVYRIAQESLTNVVRHAHAQHVQVRLVADEQTLRLEVADDGRGLDGTRAGGVGVPSMRHRAESLSGTLDLTSTGRGTTVVAQLPLTGSAP